MVFCLGNMPDLILYHLPSHRANNKVVILLPVCWDQYHHHPWTSDVLHPSLRCQLQVELLFLSSVGVCDATSHHLMLWADGIRWSQHPFLDFILSSKCPLRKWGCLFYLYRSCSTSTSCRSMLSINWWSAAGEGRVSRQRHPVVTSWHVPTSIAVSWTLLSFGRISQLNFFLVKWYYWVCRQFSRSFSFDEIMLAASTCMNWCGEVDNVRIRRVHTRHSLTRLVCKTTMTIVGLASSVFNQAPS